MEDELLAQSILHFRDGTHSLEANHTPPLPARCCEQALITSFVRKCSNVLGKCFESWIYKLPLTSHQRTYSKASQERCVVGGN